METGMFVYKFDFTENKPDEGLSGGAAATSGGVGIVTSCKHWLLEAKDQKGEGMTTAR